MVDWTAINHIQDFDRRRQVIINVLRAEQERIRALPERIDQVIAALEMTSDATTHVVAMSAPTSIIIAIEGKQAIIPISENISQSVLDELLR